ncbi:hypothetical protein CAPTEDRAFT_202850 [Capitella teleta]|uniref:Uncharacterized protein n=1 Tax=Capitella teleta TaxID=283909 RepID=R7UHG4_CAPTE|nr:hypothetical protein CAPTEDRAFT_202850 [Capitella teleta]|eukprot:ELU05523.1 hypothetical protein CAPTEDRAFT_202850 [Capitella teleta]
MVDTLRPMQPPAPWQSPCQTSWPSSPPRLNDWTASVVGRKSASACIGRYSNTDFGLPMRSSIASCQFKTTPVAATYQQRPFVGRCCSCMPNSKSDLYRDEFSRPNLHNIFNVDTKHPENGWWTRSFCYFVYLWRRTIPGDFPDITDDVLCTSSSLDILLIEACQENDFTKKTHQHLKDRVLNGTASYAESAGLDGLRNAIRGLQHMKVLRRYVAANVSMLQLSPSYKDEISIKKFLRDVGMHLGVPLAQ